MNLFALFMLPFFSQPWIYINIKKCNVLDMYTNTSHAHVRVNIFFYPLTFFFFDSLSSSHFDIFYVSHILSWAFLAFRVAKNILHKKKENSKNVIL